MMLISSGHASLGSKQNYFRNPLRFYWVLTSMEPSWPTNVSISQWYSALLAHLAPSTAILILKIKGEEFFFSLPLSSIGPCYNAELAMDFSGKGLRNILRTSATQSSAVFLLPAHGSWAHVCVFSVAQPCPALCDPTDYSPLGCMSMAFSRQECYKWVAISSSRVASWPRDPLPLPSLLFWQADSLSLSHWNTP